MQRQGRASGVNRLNNRLNNKLKNALKRR